MTIKMILLCLLVSAVQAFGAETIVEVMPSVSRAPGLYEAPSLLTVPTSAYAARLSVNRLAFVESGREACFAYRMSVDQGNTWLPGYEGCAGPFVTGQNPAPYMLIEMRDVGNPDRRIGVSLEVKGGEVQVSVSVTWID
jgi:hypothetical protein